MAKVLTRKQSSDKIGQRLSLRTLARRVIRQKRQETEANKRKEKLEKLQSIPLDALASEFLQVNEDVDLQTRVFLVEHCLAPVVMGLEKTLKEVEKRGLVNGRDAVDGFNPIDFLASFLMRNNPRYSNFSDASPYMASLKRVETHLKQKLHSASGDRKQQIVADVQRRRSQFELQHKQQLLQSESLLEPLWTDNTCTFSAHALKQAVAQLSIEQVASFDTSRQKLPPQPTKQQVIAFLHPLMVSIPAEDRESAIKQLVIALKPAIDSVERAADPDQAVAEEIVLATYATLTKSYPTTVTLFASLS
eukprot:TRINITY_DN4733_c0_g1_i2.p1 TRINITY_DN4733_c0_g1~~TRINITY_DN4733_c0_g1_i2.p1  ORF type:complete len:314 (+),score=48.03 TRINITY_DN4733_c0_g1_i2:30-944(+)